MAVRRGAHGRGSFARAPRRQTDWFGVTDAGYLAVAAGAKALIASAAIDSSPGVLMGSTLVRSRGLVSVKLQTYAADLNVIGAFGMAIVSAEAAAAGIASIPGPWSNSEWDGWFVWGTWAFAYEFTTDIDRLLPASVQIPVDSKAMRKLESGNTIVFVAESQSAAFEIVMPIRVLVKLP